MLLRRGLKNLACAARGYSIQAAAAREKQLQELALLNENCILVDTDDTAIGPASKKDSHRVDTNGQVKLHRAFSVFLFNPRGEMLLQRRSKHKITFPDTYTNACCSHPLYDIPAEREEANALGIRRAAQRRLNFELGIPTSQAQPEDFHYLTRIQYQSTGDGVWGEHEIDYILILQKDVDLKPNPSEISEVRFITRENLESEIMSLDAPLTPWFHLILKHRLKKWWDNLQNLQQFEDHHQIHRF